MPNPSKLMGNIAPSLPLLFGKVETKPLRGWPEDGTVEIRVREDDFVTGRVRAPDGTLKIFYVSETEDGFWVPMVEAHDKNSKAGCGCAACLWDEEESSSE